MNGSGRAAADRRIIADRHGPWRSAFVATSLSAVRASIDGTAARARKGVTMSGAAVIRASTSRQSAMTANNRGMSAVDST